jgi:hypothetical protein
MALQLIVMCDQLDVEEDVATSAADHWRRAVTTQPFFAQLLQQRHCYLRRRVVMT